jgi:hypothetical protein
LLASSQDCTRFQIAVMKGQSLQRCDANSVSVRHNLHIRSWSHPLIANMSAVSSFPCMASQENNLYFGLACVHALDLLGKESRVRTLELHPVCRACTVDIVFG